MQEKDVINRTEQEEVKRDKNGRWIPGGNSPNPKGRPRSSSEIQNLLSSHKDHLVTKAIEMALDGDSVALKLCLNKLFPPHKLEFEAVHICGFGDCKSLKEKTDKVIQAVTSGLLSVDIGKSLLELLEKEFNLNDFEDLKERVFKIENELGEGYVDM